MMEPPPESPHQPEDCDNDDDTHAPSEASEKPCEPEKKKKRCTVVLTDEQEDDAAEWIKDNPILYSKGLKEYRDVQKKIRLLDANALRQTKIQYDRPGIATNTPTVSLRLCTITSR